MNQPTEIWLLRDKAGEWVEANDDWDRATNAVMAFFREADAIAAAEEFALDGVRVTPVRVFPPAPDQADAPPDPARLDGEVS